MITEIYVENVKIDINNDIDALLTYAIDDIKDFSSRNCNFSKTIVIPGTQLNNRLFNSLFELGQTGIYNDNNANIGVNYNVAKSSPCIILQNNLQVFKGVFRIMEVIVDKDSIEYECSVYGELGGLISALGAAKLDDLDFSEYNLEYTQYIIEDSWNHINGSGVYFPLIDYGNQSTDKRNWGTKAFKPALYVREYLYKIFKYAKYDFDPTFFDSPLIRRLIIPYNAKVLNTVKTNAFQVETYNIPNNTTMYLSDSTTQFNQLHRVIYAGYFTTTDGINYTFSSPSPQNIKVYFSQSYSFYCQIAEYDDGLVQYDLRIEMKIERSGGGTTFLFNHSTRVIYQRNYSVNVYIDTNFVINPGDVFSYNIYITGVEYPGSNFPLKITSYNEILNFNYFAPTITPIEINDDIFINDAIPKNILQKDFLASIMKMFNLYLYEDTLESRFIRISPYINFYSNIADVRNRIDWTYKLDYDKPLSIKPLSELNARYYKFTYKSDSDYYNDLYHKRYNLTYGSFKFDTEYEFANEEKLIEVIFSGTPCVQYEPNGKIYPTIFKRTGNPGSYIEEPVDSNIRILQARKWDDVTPFNCGGHTIDYYGYAGHFNRPTNIENDINFGIQNEYFMDVANSTNISNNLFTIFWLPYMYEIIDQDSRMLTATFRLNEQDINMLDFSKLININGVLYRLNKISDYNANARDTCKVELLKVIQLNYT